jgi:hypothetical protein
MKIFTGLMRVQAKLPIKVFAVAIHKANAVSHDYECRRAAWQFALQRIHTFSSKESDCAMLFPDEGHGFFIRALLRKLRRHHTVPTFWGKGTIALNLERIIEDPNDRTSHNSLFTQLADWNVYAAHKSRHVSPSAHVPVDAWDKLGTSLLRAVNKNRGGPPAIVSWP